MRQLLILSFLCTSVIASPALSSQDRPPLKEQCIVGPLGVKVSRGTAADAIDRGIEVERLLDSYPVRFAHIRNDGGSLSIRLA